MALKRPRIEVTEGFFTIIFSGPKRPEIIIPETVELNERQKKALEYIQNIGTITRQEYEKVNNVPERTANYDLKSMLKKGILLKIGKARLVKYVIK
jgi:ATP-dependent DNA helicase RecG